jgi:hypothetical protein
MNVQKKEKEINFSRAFLFRSMSRQRKVVKGVDFTNILLFCMKVLRKALLCLKYRLNFFWRKKIGANVGEMDHRLHSLN